MKLSDVAIQKPVFTWMLMAGLLLFGGLAYREMGISQLPDVDFPVVSIKASLEGAAPEVMETQVVDPIESAVLSIQGIKNISSTARHGGASITVEFDLEKNIDIAVQEVQTILARTQRRLPDGMEPPIVYKRNPEDRPIIWLSVSSKEMSTRELMEFVRDRVKDRFATVDGVAEVNLGGYLEPNLRVWVNANKLNQYFLTVDDILNTIQNEHVEVPGGVIEAEKVEKSVRMMGEVGTVKAFEDLVISRRGGSTNYRPIRLNEIAEIEDGLEDIRRVSRTMGLPSVGIGIIKQRGSNAVGVADAVKERLAEIAPGLPKGMSMQVNFDSTVFIRESVHELVFTIVLSAILTALVCWLFLGSWSATINVVLAIPTSIVGSFIVLNYLGFTLNTFTLLGLSLAIGIVVDDAIMVLENIVRHREKGKARVDAALFGTREIAFAALAATAAIIAIFLPVAFMSGVIGRYFFQFGVTISVAVALSLFEALTLTPMRCSQFLEMGERTTRIGRAMESAFKWLEIGYRRSLDMLLGHRWKVIGASLVIFALSIGLIGILSREFVPKQDQSTLMVRMQAPEGSSLSHTDSKVRQVEALLKGHSEVERFFAVVGGFGGGEVNTGMAFVTLVPPGDRGVSQQEFSDQLREELREIKGLKAYVQDTSSGSLGGKRGYPIEFSIRGPILPKLVEYQKEMMTRLEATGLATDVNSDYQEGVPEVRVVPDRVAAARFGVSVSEIGQTLNSLVGGVVAGLYTKGGKRYDIRVRLRPGERNATDDLLKLLVRNSRGELIPLSSLVKVEDGTGPQSISRSDRERSIEISANLAGDASQATVLGRIRDIAAEILPNGYRMELSGSSRQFEEAFAGMLFALALGLIVSYMVLASQFNSFVHPVTVLMALPFSVSGAFFALWITGQTINLYSMIGLILLMGIVKKNSILLVDFTNQVRAERGGSGPESVIEALKQACPVRLRPILMTSFATISAAIPPAIGFGPGAESTRPMAIAVIGGVIVSTVLTLFVVPCVYSLFSKVQKDTLLTATPATEHAAVH